MAKPGPASGAEYGNITIAGEARVQLGNSYVTNHIRITNALARDVYRACIKSSSSFGPLAKDIASFRSLIEMTEDSIAELGPDQRNDERITAVVSRCKDCLQDVQLSVTKYNGLPVATQRTWERMEWGAEEVSELQTQLARNLGLLTSLNSNLVGSSQRAIKEILEKLMDEVRSGKRESSVVSRQTVDSLTMDEREAWRELRKQLEDVGITPVLFTQHRDLITNTLQDAISAGLLEEAPIPPPSLDVIHENDNEPSVVTLTNGAIVVPQFKNRPFPITQKSDPTMMKYNSSSQISNSEGAKVAENSTTSPASDSNNYSQGNSDTTFSKSNLPKKPSRTVKALNSIFGRNKAFFRAVQAGDTTAILTYLQKNVDIDQRDEFGDSALQNACRSGNDAMVSLLLSHSANVELSGAGGMTSLMVASGDGHIEAAKLLVQMGAKVDTRSVDGATALICACASPEAPVLLVQFLLDHGADIEATDSEGNTSLIIAFSRNYLNSANTRRNQIKKMLLEKGANCNASNKLSRTALHGACARHSVIDMWRLLSNGADPDSADKYGETLLAVVLRDVFYFHVMRVLIERGAGKTYSTAEWHILLQRISDAPISHVAERDVAADFIQRAMDFHSRNQQKIDWRVSYIDLSSDPVVLRDAGQIYPIKEN